MIVAKFNKTVRIKTGKIVKLAKIQQVFVRSKIIAIR